jgi:putative DNA primase/helicase
MIHAECLPLDIRESPRGVLWNFETRPGEAKPTKVPYQPSHPASKAAVDNPATWAPITDALAAFEDGKADGVGIVLGDGLVGVDLDACRDVVTGELTSEARTIIAALSSYTEISPSGTGVHVLLRGDLPAGGRRKGKIEIYAERRYFTLTGARVPGTPATIEVRSAELAALHAQLFQPSVNGNGHGPHVPRVDDLDDAALIERARQARNGATFSALWNGDTSAHGGDDSAADLALCNLLAFWTNGDTSRIDRLFRQSGLMRAKWDSRRGAETYGDNTIGKAIAGIRDTYQPNSNRHRAVRNGNGSVERCSERAPEDHLTESGAAERFARLHGDAVRHDYLRQRFLIWQGHRWMPDADAAVLRLALDFARAWQREAVEIPDLEKRTATIKLAMRLERRDAMNNMLAIAKALKPIADAGDAWDQSRYLLCTPSAVVDLETGGGRPGRPADGLTLQTAAPYEPDARCPRWERFVSEISGGDATLMGFIQRAIGYSITGVTTEQVLFLLYGTGANGKGTFVNTLKRVLGDYAWNMPFATIEMKDRAAIPNDLAALVNRRFVIASETNDGTRLNESRVKALTGCDPITARFLHGEFFTFEPLAKFWLSVNHKPIVRDDSYGFWRRLRLIPFSQRFDVDPGLADELQAEAAGILMWCIRGALAWQRDGLQAPGIVTAATSEYEHDSDPLGRFIAEACELEPTAEIGAKELYEHYKKWAEAHGLTDRERLTSTMFGRKIAERFRRIDGARRTYIGVARGPLL